MVNQDSKGWFQNLQDYKSLLSEQITGIEVYLQANNITNENLLRL